MTFMSTGVRHAVGPFLKPIVADLGLDPAGFSAVIALILTTGWRTTYVLIAGGILALSLPLCLWVVRDSPESIGLRADGAAVKPGTTAAPIERVTGREALQTLAFWQLAGSFFTCGFSMSLLSAHGIPMLTDHGYSPMFASWALGVLGGPATGSAVAGLLFETTGGYGAAFAVACCFLVGASIVALNIDKGARRIWRAATASATN